MVKGKQLMNFYKTFSTNQLETKLIEKQQNFEISGLSGFQKQILRDEIYFIKNELKTR